MRRREQFSALCEVQREVLLPAENKGGKLERQLATLVDNESKATNDIQKAEEKTLKHNSIYAPEARTSMS